MQKRVQSWVWITTCIDEYDKSVRSYTVREACIFITGIEAVIVMTQAT